MQTEKIEFDQNHDNAPLRMNLSMKWTQHVAPWCYVTAKWRHGLHGLPHWTFNYSTNLGFFRWCDLYVATEEYRRNFPYMASGTPRVYTHVWKTFLFLPCNVLSNYQTFTNFLCLLERLTDKFYKYQLGSKMLFNVSYGLWTKKIIAKILH